MAISLTNTCEGTSGTAIAATSIGAPNPFNASTKSGTGAAQTFDSAQFHGGSTSMNFALPASVAASTYVDWTSTTITTATANAYLRFYVYLPANPTVNTRLAAFLGTGLLNASLQLWNNSGSTWTLRTINNAGGQIANMTATIPLNQWVRVEFEIVGQSGTSATVNARMYLGDSTTAISGGSLSTAGAVLSANLTNDVRLGMSSAVTMTSAWNAWFDDAAFSDTAQPGPMATTMQGSASSTWSVTATAAGARTPHGSTTAPTWSVTAAAAGTAPAGTLQPPAGLTVTVASATQLNLSWTAASGASGYDIERDGAVVATSVVGTAWSDTGLAPSTTYTYRIRSVA